MRTTRSRLARFFDFDLADKNVSVEIDGVVAIQHQLHLRMFQTYAGGEGIAQIALVNVPALAGGPEELVAVGAGHIAVNSEPAWAGASVVFLPDAREVDVAGSGTCCRR